MEEIREDCPCKREKCERHGNCSACREHHSSKRRPPSCERMEQRAKRKERR